VRDKVAIGAIASNDNISMIMLNASMKKTDTVPGRLEEYLQHLRVPPRPFDAAWEDIPEIVRVSLEPLSGIQPITKQMADRAGGVLRTKPSDAEIEFFQQQGTTFQMIKLVMIMAYWEEVDGAIRGTPSSIYAVPAIKRDKVQSVGINTVAQIADAFEGRVVEDVIMDFDPFSGKHGGTILNGDYVHWAREKIDLSDIGFVFKRYFLAESFDREDLLEFDNFIPESSRKNYRKNRVKKLYTPFKQWKSRQIWGLESDIERFMLQELRSRGLRPELQWIIYKTGECFPSMWDVYRDVEFRHGVDTLTSADLFFPKERIAVFCDGSKHHKKEKDRRKDELINTRLEEMSIVPIRVTGREIRENLKSAGDKVEEALTRLSRLS
jgi:hypothetical protein